MPLLHRGDPAAAWFERWDAPDAESNVELTLLLMASIASLGHSYARDKAREIVRELEADGFRIVRA